MLDHYEVLNASPSFQDSLKSLEADIHHANMIATSIPRGKGRACLQMKLVYNHLAPTFLFLLRWMNCSCRCLITSYLSLFHVIVYEAESNGKPNVSSCGRKATIKEFYSVILPSLQRLQVGLMDSGISEDEDKNKKTLNVENKRKPFDVELERENECGICLEPCTKMVLPNCCHTMCVNCYHDWNTRSESCPFCRGSLRRVNSGDLWVLTCSSDVIDVQTVLREDLLRFHLYINSLPQEVPDALFLMYFEYLF